MMYLLQQHLLWVVLALVVGLILGWYFCRKSA